MAFKNGARGINQTGKTKGKNLGDSGPNVGIEVGKKPAKGVTGGKTNEDMQAMGRNLAKVKANGK
jgi:hypothetical protein